MITIQSPNMLIIRDTDMYVQDSDGQILLETKPTLTFEYEEIRYYIGEQLYSIDGTNFISLSTEQQDEIEQFISNKRAEVGILKLAVDSDGRYLGRINTSDSRIASLVDMAPPNLESNWRWNFESNSWMMAYFYDNMGNLVSSSSDQKVGYTLEPFPNKPFYKFDLQNKKWIISATHAMIEDYKKKLIREILTRYFSVIVETADVSIVQIKLNEINENISYDKIVSSSINEIMLGESIEAIDDISQSTILSLHL